VNVSYTELCYLGLQITAHDYGNIKDREFAYVHMLETFEPLKDFKLQESEVLGIGMLKIRDALELFSDKRKVCNGVLIIYKEGTPIFERIEININDFVLRKDLYYLKVCQQADLYFKGYDILVI